MKPLALISISLLFGFLTMYFLWRYALHRRAPSLLCAAMPVGWVAYAVRALRGDGSDDVVVLVALALGLWGVTIVVLHETEQPFPFR